MVRILLIVVFVFCFDGLFAQEKDVLFTFNGKSSTLFLTAAPEFDRQVFIYRKEGAGEFIALNEKNPMRKFGETDELVNAAGDQLQALMEYTGAESYDDLARIVSGSSYQADLVALLFPGAAMACGRIFKDTTAVANREYQYKIVYANLVGTPVEEFTKRVKTVTLIPQAPAGVKAEFKNSFVTLQWEYPKWENDKSNLTIRFDVYKKDSKNGFVKINDKIILRNDANLAQFTELISGTAKEAEYSIKAIDLAGAESPASQSVTVKLVSNELPDPPIGLSSIVERDRIQLLWSVSPQGAVNGYNVYRKEKSKRDSLKLNKSLLPVNRPEFTDSSAKSAVIYYYYVTAMGLNGKESRLSTMAVGEILDTIPPSAPAALKTSQFGDFVKIEWRASQSNDVKHYNIYRGESRGILAKTGMSFTTTFIDSGYDGKTMIPGQLYYYAISATDNVDIEGDLSDTVVFKYIDKVAPPAPIPFTAKNTENRHIVVRVGMTPVKDLAKVNIYRRKKGSAEKEQLISTLNKLPNVFSDTTGILNQTYIYIAESIDSSGNKSTQSFSNEVTVKDLLTPAAVPFISTALIKEGGIKISWIAVYESDLDGYNVYFSQLPNGTYTLINDKPVKSTTLVDPQGKKGFFYKVRAVDTSGNESEWSEAASLQDEETPEDEGQNNE